MIELAHAYIENLILHDFIAATELDMSGKSKEVLTILLQIFALDTIEKHRGWYLENDYMEGEKSKAIERTHVILGRKRKCSLL